MKVWYVLLMGLMISNIAWAQEELGLRGKVVDTTTGEELMGANVVVTKNGHYIAGTSTDFDGNYELKLAPGIYTVETNYIGYPPNLITGVVLTKGDEMTLNITLGDDDFDPLRIVIVRCINIPLIDIYQPGGDNLNRVNSREIRDNPHKDISAIALGCSAGISGGL